jgi:hypothetical protein
MLAIFYFGSMYGMSVASNYKTYGEKFYTDDHFLSISGSIGSFFNGSIRVVYGLLMDNFSFKVCLGSVLGLQIVGNLLMVLIPDN